MEELHDKVLETANDTAPEPVEVPQPSPKNNFWNFFQKNFLALAILTAGIMVSGSVLYTGGIKTAAINDVAGAGEDVRKDVSPDDDPALGPKGAKVTIIEFSDFQCPYCRTWWKDTFSQLKKEFIDTGKVRFIYRDFPLSFHPMAAPSAEAANCAGEQGKYWEMHDKLFSEQLKKGQGTITYEVKDIKNWAAQIGLNGSQFNQCLDSGKFKAEVEKDFADGSAAGVSGTPSFFINGKLVVGAQPYATFKSLIEQELKK
jgi:protein-disulfide isomerase